jgi:hypothetical protein
MKAVAVLAFALATTAPAFAQEPVRGPVLVDPDFALTYAPTPGFEAELVGQLPDAFPTIAVTTTNPDLPAIDPSGVLCEISFEYYPTFGQGDQAWVNSLVDGTGFYERGVDEVPVPGTTEGGTHFTHRGASSHRYEGQHELGGSFAVSAIPTPEGFALVTCASAAEVDDWSALEPMVEAITVPGQPRDHLIANGQCDADISEIDAIFETARGNLDGLAIVALDEQRAALARQCDGLHADAIMDEATQKAGHDAPYRTLRYNTLADIGSELLTDEEHAALDGGREEIVATSDTPSGERYLRYMHFMVGLHSLDR